VIKNTALLDKIKNWITYKAKKMTNAKKGILKYWVTGSNKILDHI